VPEERMKAEGYGELLGLLDKQRTR